MRKYDDWITPQVYAGIAYKELGDRSQVEDLLGSAERRIGSDPRYVPLLPIIARRLQKRTPPPGETKNEKEERLLHELIESMSPVAPPIRYSLSDNPLVSVRCGREWG